MYHYAHKILPSEAANLHIGRILAGPGGALVGRIGATEQAVLRRAFLLRSRSFEQRLRESDGRLIGPVLRRDIRVESGFFPTDNASMIRFANLYLEILPDLDALGVWFNRGEGSIVRACGNDTALVPLTTLWPVLAEKPWTYSLRNRRVLVVHPFTKSIGLQIPKLESIWPDGLMPPAEYECLAPPQTLGGFSDHKSWFDGLDRTCAGIAESRADVVLVAAGAYGLPLAHYAATQGKSAIVVGGALQLLFGIRGARWDGRPELQRSFNENWVRPLPEETPPGALGADRGAYW